MFYKIIFVTIVTTVYFFMNFFVLYKTFGILNIKDKKLLWILVLVFSFSFPISMILHQATDNIFSKVFYILSISWFSIIVISIPIIAIYTLISIKFKNNIFGYITLLIIILVCSLAFYNGKNLTINEINIKIPHIKQNYKIAYMSDIHINTINTQNYINKIVENIIKIKPDFVLINGDIIDSTLLTYDKLKLFDRLDIPIYATLGNHEIYRGKQYVIDLLSKTNIKLLINEKVQYNEIQILGSDELMQFNGNTRTYDLKKLETFLKSANIDNNKPSILMVHEPVGTEISSRFGIDLQLAGHTHNGQIWPFNYFVKIFFKYINGLYKIQDMYLYVGPGTGTWGPPMRLGSKNEITIINLQK